MDAILVWLIVIVSASILAIAANTSFDKINKLIFNKQ